MCFSLWTLTQVVSHPVWNSSQVKSIGLTFSLISRIFTSEVGREREIMCRGEKLHLTFFILVFPFGNIIWTRASH